MTNKVFIKQELTGTQVSEESDQVLDLRKCGIGGGKTAVNDCRRRSDEQQSGTLSSCTWCGKKGDFKDAGAPTGFCSSVCFDQYRRDCFKKRSACIWCSASASRQNLISNASSVDESKFCSPQCLAQFKVRVFCEETTAHLDQLKDVSMIRPEVIDDLITPELWLHQSLRRNPVGDEKKPQGSSSKLSLHKRTSSSASIPPPTSPVDLLEMAKRPHLIPKQDYRHHHHLTAIRRRPHRSNHVDTAIRSPRSQLDKHDDILMPLIPPASQQQTIAKDANGGSGKHRQVLKQMENGSATLGLMRQARMPLPPLNVLGIDSLQLLNPFTSLSASEDASWNQEALMREKLPSSRVDGGRAEGVNEISRINYASPGLAMSSLSPGTKTKEGPNQNATVISLSRCQGRNNDISSRQSSDDSCNKKETNFMSNSQCYPILLPIPVPIPIPIPIFISRDCFRKNLSSPKSCNGKNQESKSDSKKAGTSEAVTDSSSPVGFNGFSNRAGSISSNGSEGLSDAIKDDESYD